MKVERDLGYSVFVKDHVVWVSTTTMHTKKETGPVFGVRHIQCLLLFTCVFVMYTILSNIPLAIVAMTDSSKANPDFEEFNWNEQTRASILSSFFWGYIVSQIPCGALVTRFGSKTVLLIGVGTNCILNLIIPICTSLGGSGALLTLRILQGAFQGVLFPSTHGLIANWAPIHERSHLSVLIYPGAQIGAIVSLLTGGHVAASSLGWPGIFYIWGIVGLVWCVVWWWFGANSPMEHASITTAERDYIMESTSGHSIKQPTPWGKILRSTAFYALLITHTLSAYTFWTITTITPTYLNGLFGLNIQQNAMLSAIPCIGLFVLSHVFAEMSKFCTNKLKLSLRQLRISFNSFGFMVSAVALVALGFVNNDDPTLAVTLLTVAYGVLSAMFVGFYVNHMDLCPTHAAILMGVTNSVATIGGIISTLAVGWLVKDESDPSHWRIIFLVGTVLLVIATLVFGFFGRFENQNWVPSDNKEAPRDSDLTPSGLATIKTTV